MADTEKPSANEADEFGRWLDEALPRHARLTETVVAIVRGLLVQSGVEFLSVTGRTKDRNSAMEKVERKSYRRPISQMMDLTGVRIVVFIESDIKKASDAIEATFKIDPEHSSNKDVELSTNRVGYRSVHYVCDIGDVRSALPENNGLEGLKFELQIRTVLQHAWAELHHDRSYKFKSSLPPEIERSLYLYAGLLEVADKGFSQIAEKIDQYRIEYDSQINSGNLSAPLNSLSLESYVRKWVQETGYQLEPLSEKSDVDDLVQELKNFGVSSINDLEKIISKDFIKNAKKFRFYSNIMGLVRDWMVTRNISRVISDVSPGWIVVFERDNDYEFYSRTMSEEDFAILDGWAIDARDTYDVDDLL